MIKLKPKTKEILSTILETVNKRKEYGKLHSKNAKIIDSLYVIDDMAAYIMRKEMETKIEAQRWEDVKKLIDSNYSQENYSALIEQVSEKYNRLLEDLPEIKRCIPEEKKKEFEELERDNKILFELCEVKEQEEKQLISLLQDAVIEEYGLSGKYARIGANKNKNKKLYYNPVLSADDRSFSEICFNLLGQGFDFKECNISGIGLCVLLEDLDHLKNYCNEHEEKPKNVLKVSINPNANLHYIDHESYASEDYKEYEKHFDSEDYQLLDAVQAESFGYYRYLFDIAMGYDATVVSYPDSDKKLYAVYNRSILEINRQAVKTIDEVLEEDSMNK